MFDYIGVISDIILPIHIILIVQFCLSFKYFSKLNFLSSDLQNNCI